MNITELNKNQWNRYKWSNFFALDCTIISSPLNLLNLIYLQTENGNKVEKKVDKDLLSKKMLILI